MNLTLKEIDVSCGIRKQYNTIGGRKWIYICIICIWHLK